MGTVADASKEAMPDLKTRDEYIEYLDEVASGWKPKGNRRANLVKSYLVETSRHAEGMPLALTAAGMTLNRAGDSAMFRLHGPSGDVLAVMDNADTRFPVVHSTISADAADKVVRDSVMGSPHLDHVWLPGSFFDGLWNWAKQTSDPRRIAKLVFAFTGKYEQADDDDAADNDEADYDETDYNAASDSDAIDFDAIEDDFVGETRRSQFAIEDRVEILDRKLLELKSTYDPLQSTVRMRIPSGGHGGHEIYNTGKITNRSGSFAEQAKIIQLVTDVYRTVTEDVERSLWYTSDSDCEDSAALAGQPVLFEFPEPLEASTLRRWADLTFGNKRNAFRLGGEPMWSGDDKTRLHVYGVDRHLWQPIALEATPTHFLILLPEGTCGNTINRLATRVQETLCPTVQTWLGDRRYQDILAASAPLAA
jgi:hypothetical protein